MVKQEELNGEQVEMLYDAEQIRKQDDEPVVVAESALDDCREVLGAALAARVDGKVNPDEMSLEALASQFQSDDEKSTAVAALSQQPETGGAKPDETDETDGVDVDALSPSTARDAYQRVRKLERLRKRTPKYAEEMSEEVAADLGLDDPEDIPPKEEFQEVLEQ